MSQSITRETPTEMLRDALYGVFKPIHEQGKPSWEAEIARHPEAYEGVTAQSAVDADSDETVAGFIRNHPTLGDIVDDRSKIFKDYPELKDLLENLFEKEGLIKPLSADGNLASLVQAYLETPKPELTDPLDSRIRNKLGEFRENVPDGVLKDVKGKPYANIGEILADGANGKRALAGGLGLGPVGADRLLGFARAALGHSSQIER